MTVSESKPAEDGPTPQLESLPTLERAGIKEERVLVLQDRCPRAPGEEASGHRNWPARLEVSLDSDERAVHDPEAH